ncbi:uncharacterized protein LOC122501773 [Leptopilina heterotoma]|uniref:uncharacterized protein LOC122501773 n=1 Tax=Leptopilina heterotoma TaxID=63436 RepID=UPI001CA88A7D|nr:uncharacterized protein LOC122501773 [Leptopilina heterotoma]
MSTIRVNIFCLTIFLIIIVCNSFSYFDIVQDPDLVGKQLACIKGLKECSALEEENRALFIKYALNKCQECTENEHEKIRLFVWYLSNYYPAVYEDLQNLATQLASSYYANPKYFIG